MMMMTMMTKWTMIKWMLMIPSLLLFSGQQDGRQIVFWSLKGKNGTGVINLKRHLGAYISSRDLTKLFDKSISANKVKGNIENVPFLVVYGVSDNTRRFWSLDTAKQYLNYSPKDDSEVKFHEIIKNIFDTDTWKSKLG